MSNFDENLEADVVVANKHKEYPSSFQLERKLIRLKRLFPTKSTYCLQGYGHNVVPVEIEFDPTLKEVPSEKIIEPLLVSINSNFRGLSENLIRPTDWEEFHHLVLMKRRDILVLCNQLLEGLNNYFRNGNLVGEPGKTIDKKTWNELKTTSANPVLLPLCAVDPWGLLDESSSRSANREAQNTSISKDTIRSSVTSIFLIEEYRPLQEKLRKYLFAMFNFFDQATFVIQVLTGFYNQNTLKSELNHKFDLLTSHHHQFKNSVLNLIEAYIVLVEMQQRYKEFLINFVDEGELNAVDMEEKASFADLLPSWVYFVHYPSTHSPNAFQLAKRQIEKTQVKIEKQVAKSLRRLCNGDLSFKFIQVEPSWNPHAQAACITVNGSDAVKVYTDWASSLEEIKQVFEKFCDRKLLHFITRIFLYKFVVIPLVNNRSLDGKGYHSYMFKVATQGKSALSLSSQIPKPIPNQIVHRLEVNKWTDVEIELAFNYCGLVSNHSTFLRHLVDLNRLKPKDSLGTKILIQHFKSILGQLQDNLDKYEVARSEISHLLNHDNLMPDNIPEQHASLAPLFHWVDDQNIEHLQEGAWWLLLKIVSIHIASRNTHSL